MALEVQEYVFRQWISVFYVPVVAEWTSQDGREPAWKPPLSNRFRIFEVWSEDNCPYPRFNSAVLVWSPHDKEFVWSLEEYVDIGASVRLTVVQQENIG